MTRGRRPKLDQRRHALSVPRVQIATISNIFIGRCSALKDSTSRLLDLLNKESPLLILEGCRVRPLHDSPEPVPLARTCIVRKDRIVWARPLGPASKPSAVNNLVVDKECTSVVAFAPPFRITGLTHTLPGADPTLALTRLVTGFLPLTNVGVRLDADDGTSWNAKVLILNGRMTDIISASAIGQLVELTGERSAA